MCVARWIALWCVVVWAGEAAAQPVRVSETRIGTELGEVVTLNNGWVRVEVRPREGLVRVNGQEVVLSRGVWGASKQMRDRVSGYGVREHENGSVSVVMMLRGDATCVRTAYVHVPVGTGVVTLRTVVDNRGELPELVDGQWWMAMSEGVEPLGSRWGRTTEGAVGRGYTGWYDAARTVNVLAFGGGAGVWSWRDGGGERVGVRGSDPNAERYVGRWCRRVDDLYLVVLPRFGRVTAASPHAVVSSSRVGERWLVQLQPMRRMLGGKLRVTGELESFEQTINAGPGEPLMLEVPIDQAELGLELTDARGRQWLGVTLSGEGGAELGAAEGADVWPIASLREETAALYAEAMEAMRGRDAKRAVALLRPVMERDEAGRGSWGFVFYVTALIQAGEREEGVRLLRSRVEREPGLMEAWLMLGEWETARSLVRYDDAAWKRLCTSYSAQIGMAISGTRPIAE